MAIERLSAEEIRKLALKHNRSTYKKKNYGFLVRKYGQLQARKITDLARYIAKDKMKKMVAKKKRHLKKIKQEKKSRPFGLLPQLGQEMRELGYTGKLSDYPTPQDRRAWIEVASRKSNPSKGTSVLGALILGGIIGHSMKK